METGSVSADGITWTEISLAILRTADGFRGFSCRVLVYGISWYNKYDK